MPGGSVTIRRIEVNALRQRTLGRVLLGLVIVGSSACFMTSGPEDVAYDFWDAARDGDRERIEALVLDPRDVRLDFEDEDARIESFEIGDAEIDDDVARVETWVTGSADDVVMDLEFETVLVRRDGEWWVDVEETGRRLVVAVVGASVEGLGEAIGEGMKGAMEGLAEGMEEFGRALQEAGEEMRQGSGGSS